MTDHTVHLDRVFEGPMDLLLHLVREQEVEIHEIEVSRIVDGYLAHLRRLEDLDIEYAGDFLVMAATLLSVKSRSLLPREEVDLETELDPREELVQRLIEYRRFRDAAERLGELWARRLEKHERGWRGEVAELAADDEERTLDLGDLGPFDLLAAWSRLLRETLADRRIEVAADPRPLRFYVERVVGAVRGGRRLSLGELLATLGDVPPREALIGSFCAVLELVRLQLVDVRQEGPGSEIALELRPDREADALEVVGSAGFADEGPAEDAAGSEAAAKGGSGAGFDPETDPSYPPPVDREGDHESTRSER